MKAEIKKILYEFLQDGITSDSAVNKIINVVTNERELVNSFEKWLLNYKKTENDCFWYTKEILYCRQAMFHIFLEYK
jgi:hypothetical protein